MDESKRWDNRIAVVVLGDMVVFLAFVILGKAEHGVSLSDALFRTALPFAVVWFVGSPWFGSYRGSTLYSHRTTMWKIPLVWLGCGVVAIFGRAFLISQAPMLVFVLIALLVQGIFLLVWRSVFLIVVQRLPR